MVYLYIIPMLFAVIAAIILIKSYVAPGDQLTYATVFLGALFGLIIGIVPYNMFIGFSKKFISVELDSYLEQIDLPFSVEGEVDVVQLEPLPVVIDGETVMVPREEIIIPLEKSEKVSAWAPGIESTSYVAFRYHGTYKERFSFKGVTVYFHGTPMVSRNAEKVFGALVDINPVVQHLQYGRIPVIEIDRTYHGDRVMREDLDIVDTSMAVWWKKKLEKEREMSLLVK